MQGEHAQLDVLIPTCDRPCALAVTLTALSAQSFRAMRVMISDQSDTPALAESPEIAAVIRLLRYRGVPVAVQRHLPRRGMAEQRAFLLSQASAPYLLFLDDDVIIEHDLVERLYNELVKRRCGFVGSALHGLSYLHDERPQQQAIEFWQGDILPEQVAPHSPAWQRHQLHSAANLLHVQHRLNIRKENARAYRVAWVGGCVMFDTAKLRAAGGFDFWTRLPAEHSGEDVLAQLRVMRRFGGCGLIPSGAYHLELPTTLRRREIDAPHALTDEL